MQFVQLKRFFDSGYIFYSYLIYLFILFLLFLYSIVQLLYETGGNWVFRCIVAIIIAASRSTSLFTYCGFSNRKPAITWFHPRNPPVPTTGSCWWRTSGWHWISRKMLQVGHLTLGWPAHSVCVLWVTVNLVGKFPTSLILTIQAHNFPIISWL